MSFYKRYELARLIQEDDAKTFSAVEIETGRPVLLHMLAPSPNLPADQVREMVRLARECPEVIEVGEFAGSYYVATGPLEGFTTFRAWLSVAAPVQTVPAVPEPPAPIVAAPKPPTQERNLPPAAKTAEEGEFTKVFGVGKADVAGGNEPGEFTKLFYGKTPKTPAKNPDPEALLDVSNTQGEFTQFFGGVKPAKEGKVAEDGIGEFKPVFEARLSEPEDAPPIPAPASEPEEMWHDRVENRTGDYTRFFENVIPGEAIDVTAEQARQAGMVEPTEKPFRQASEFTRVFGSGANPGARPPTLIPGYPANQEKTMEFGTPAPPAASPPPAFVPGPGDTQDEYMRVVGTAERAAMYSAPPPPPAPPKKDTKRMVLIAVLVAVGLVLVGLVLFAVFSKGK